MGISIVYGSEKGGVGKTTTTANTAAMLANKGKSVGILKSDKNDDMMNWSTDRQANGLPFVPVHEAYGDIAKEIKKLASRYDYLLIDCAGHDSAEFRSALTVADIMITLVKHSSVMPLNSWIM